MKSAPVSNSTFLNGGTSYTCIVSDDTPVCTKVVYIVDRKCHWSGSDTGSKY